MDAPIEVNPRVTVWPDELQEQFVRSSGAGGQNVNKVSTAVQLRYDTKTARGLPYDVRARLKAVAGRRLNKHGVLVIDARQHRTQERNRQAARERLVALLQAASEMERQRIPSQVSRAAKRRRLADKRHRAGVKRQRQSVNDDS